MGTSKRQPLGSATGSAVVALVLGSGKTHSANGSRPKIRSGDAQVIKPPSAKPMSVATGITRTVQIERWIHWSTFL